MENSDFLISNQKQHLKYYRRHGTIKSKNTVELKSFLEKKKFLMINQKKKSNLRLRKFGIFSKKSIFSSKNTPNFMIFRDIWISVPKKAQNFEIRVFLDEKIDFLEKIPNLRSRKRFFLLIMSNFFCLERILTLLYFYF